MKVELKEDFKEKYRKILGKESEELFRYLKKPLDRSLRVNNLKIGEEKLLKRLRNYDWIMESIPWFEGAYWIREKDRPIGKTKEYMLGYYYVQEAASLIPVLALGPQSGEKILDLCAAPGSKTTQIAQAMNNQGIIVANDLEVERMSILSFNIQRCGISNCVITLEDGKNFKNKQQKFDRILVDVPCTGTGSIRVNPHIAEIWSKGEAKELSKTQKDLLLSAYNCLKEDGVLVYSTCSLAPEENEEVIDYFLSNTDGMLEEFEVEGFKTREGLGSYRGKDFDSSMRKAKRIWPQDNDTQGFFVAKIEK